MNYPTKFGLDAPECAPPDNTLRSPKNLLFSGACDCHAHILGPESKYPYADDRIYTPPNVLVSDYLAQIRMLGADRCVLVQPSVYGTDNFVMLDAMAQIVGEGVPVRGVAVCDDAVSDSELSRMHKLGVRGLRFNLVDVADPSMRSPIARIEQLCQRIAPLGWHAEFLIHVDDYPEFDSLFAGFPVPIVVGHMGYPRIGQNTQAPGFLAMLRLAELGQCWIKLSGPYRISAGNLPYAEATAYAGKIISSVPSRVVWGTDWPHVMVTKEMPNDADLCDLLTDWVSDDSTRRRILIDNPTELYGFGERHD